MLKKIFTKIKKNPTDIGDPLSPLIIIINNTVITSEDLMSSESSGDTVEVTELKRPRRDFFLQLVSLQKASGCWLLEPHLAAVLGKTREEVESPKPAAVGHCKKYEKEIMIVQKQIS